MEAVDEAEVGSAVTVVFLVTVPPPRSGYVVDLLKDIPQIESACAVYSTIDLIAVFRGTRTQYADVRKRIEGWHAPIRRIEAFFADAEFPGPSSLSATGMLKNSCRAFVQCDVSKYRDKVDFAATVLKSLQSVRHLYVSYESHKILLDIVTPDKATLDLAVMDNVQAKLSVVKSTRTFFAIDALSWERPDIGNKNPDIFVGLAAEDLQTASVLENQLEIDTGLACWDYRKIPAANRSWPRTIEDAMKVTRLHLFVVGPGFPTSPNCMEEYTRSMLRHRQREDTLCVLTPGYVVTALPHKMQEAQVVSGSDFLGYPKILNWVRDRLASPNG